LWETTAARSSYIPAIMRTIAIALLAAALTRSLVAQGADPVGPPTYRGFHAGDSYRAFAQRARALQVAADLPFVCSTARRTAQLMECRAAIQDSSDGKRFRLSAHFVNGRAGFVAFGDSGGAALVAQLQQELQGVLGAPVRRAVGTWEWGTARRFTRLNWRARGDARWIYVTLTDLDVLDGIAAYVTPTPEP